MNFKQAVNNIRTVTTNGMPTLETSSSALVDFFYQAGAMRGQDPIPLFSKASGVSMEVALRIALWLRDAWWGRRARTLPQDSSAHRSILPIPHSSVGSSESTGGWSLG